MGAAMQLSTREAGQDDDPGSAREDLIARYDRLREMSRGIHDKALDLVSEDAMLQQAGRLGIRGPGRSLIVENPIVVDYIYDLLLYTAPSGRSRAIDRCGRMAGFASGSEQGRLLQAMQHARFAVLMLERRHEIAGVVATDLVRNQKVWLVDVALEDSWMNSKCMATRLYEPAEFAVTTGVVVPVDFTLLTGMLTERARIKATSPVALVEDRRFAEKMYRVALEKGVLDRVQIRGP